MQHFDKALDFLDEIFNRGLVVPSEDFNAVRQPDRRIALSLNRKLRVKAIVGAFTEITTLDDSFEPAVIGVGFEADWELL